MSEKENRISVNASRSIIMPAKGEVQAEQRVIDIQHNLINEFVEFMCATFDENGVEIAGSRKVFHLQGKQYQDLLGGNPKWSPGKPEGVFRPLDLLGLMGEIESQNITARQQ